MNILNLEKIFRQKSQEGFTISELIISITIIGILAAIAVPSGLKWIDKEKQNAFHKYMREKEFREFADPLYFKVQRGEATQSDYDSKVAEIRAKYPYI